MSSVIPQNLGLPVLADAARSDDEDRVERWDAPGLVARLYLGSGVARWYVLIEEEVPSDVVVEELRAHVGSTYAEVRRVGGDEVDEIDAAAIELADQAVAVLALDVQDELRPAVVEGLMRFARGWVARPPVATAIQRSTGEVLREYRLAVTTGAFDEALRCIEALRGMDELNAINIGYLELELLHAQGAYASLLDHPRLMMLLDGGAPTEVRNLVATSVLETSLRGVIESLDQLRPAFADLDHRLQSLIASTDQARTPGAALVLALDRDQRSVPIEDIAATLGLIATDDPQVQAVIERLASSTLAHEPAQEAETDPVEHLRALEAEGRIDELLSYLTSVDPSLSTLAIARSVSFSINDAASLRVLVEHVDAAEADVVSALEANDYLRRGIDELRARSRESADEPESWTSLLAALRGHGWSERLRQVAKNGASRWGFKDIDHEVGSLHDALGGGNTNEVDDLVPYLLEWSDRAPDRLRSVVRRLDLALLSRLSLVDRSRSGREHMLYVVERLLTDGVDEQSYGELLEHLDVRWSSDAAPETVGWLSDAVELLLIAPATSARADFVSTAVAHLRAFAPRLVARDIEVLSGLLDEMQLGSLLEGLLPPLDGDPHPERDDGRWNGVVVGLYSLDAAVLRRVRSALLAEYPGVDVATSDAHVATDRLRAMARRADVMVVAWRVAKHPATESISEARPSRPVSWAPGRGSSSMLVLARQELDNLRPGATRPAA